MIESFINKFARQVPSKILFVIEGKEYSYSFVDTMIDKYANIFHGKYGIREQDRVVLRAERTIEFLCCYFALHRLNIIALPIDEKMQDSTLEYMIREVAPKYVLGNDNSDTLSYESIRSEACRSQAFDAYPDIDRDNIADIMFTSGTTGNPKGVKLSHLNIESSAINMSRYINNTFEDVEVLALPLCHSFGLGRVRSTILKGGTLVLHNGFSNVKSLLRLLESTNATGFSMVPAGWNIIERFSGSKISKYGSKLKYIEMGSSYLSPSEKVHLAELLPNTRICMHYGLTEASRSAFLEFHAGNLDSVGKPLPDVDIRIYHEGELLSHEDMEGEICIKGNHVTSGYWNMEHRTPEFFIDGFIRTGDIGYIHAGYLFISGRLKDVINVGGKKVSAKEIEAMTLGIEGVRECACVGIEDNVLGEVPALYIVPDDSSSIDTDKVLSVLHLKLEAYKIPRLIKKVAGLPKTENGKIKKFELALL